MKKLLQIIGVLQKPQKIDYQGKTIEQKALAHYCELCDTAFKTPQGRNSHIAIRHRKYGK